MKKANLIVFSMLIALLPFAGLSAQVTFIDFETTPTGEPTIQVTPVGSTYAEWGVIFSEIGDYPEDPIFYNAYNSDGMFAWTGHMSYPPGGNIVAEFSLPVYSVLSDVGVAFNETITMIAKDGSDEVIGSIISAPAPGTFWVGTIGIVSTIPIAKVEWWPSRTNTSVMVDNLTFEVPEPTTLILLGLGGLALLRKRS